MGLRLDTQVKLPGAATRLLAAMVVDPRTGERSARYIELSSRGELVGSYWEVCRSSRPGTRRTPAGG